MDARRVLFGEIARAYREVRATHGDRTAYGMVLIALADFLKANGLSGPVPLWLMELGSALTDLDDGVVRPLLATKKRKGLPSNEWRRRAYICLGMRVLVDGGMPRKGAARAARRASRMAEALSVNELVTLYDQFQKRDGIKNREAAHVYANSKALDFAAAGKPEQVARLYFWMSDQDHL
jgi:hypothetical protein